MMSEAMGSSIGIVGYLALFSAVGVVFLFVNLFLGSFVRARDPHPEKVEIYECGEPAIGSSYVQFDLRFYVVALLFIIFDVEVAFFFPWATVFGKATNLADGPIVVSAEGGPALAPDALATLRELGVREPRAPESAPASIAEEVRSRFGAGQAEQLTDVEASDFTARESMRSLAWLAVADILVFFGVLMVGFFYVWRRGDLDWVRAVAKTRAAISVGPTQSAGNSAGNSADREAALSA